MLNNISKLYIKNMYISIYDPLCYSVKNITKHKRILFKIIQFTRHSLSWLYLTSSWMEISFIIAKILSSRLSKVTSFFSSLSSPISTNGLNDSSVSLALYFKCYTNITNKLNLVYYLSINCFSYAWSQIVSNVVEESICFV